MSPLVRILRFIFPVTVLALLLFVLGPARFLSASASASTSAPPANDSPNAPPAVPARSEMPTNQIIVKYKESTAPGAAQAPLSSDRMTELSAAAGAPLTYYRDMSGGAHVLRLADRLPEAEVRALADRLAALPDVEYAEPDAILEPAYAPNDSLYSNQWHYFEPYGINLPAAWDITTGSTGLVVAVVDTGITNHSEFLWRTVPGYDFVSDPLKANDGDGRDANPSDPGDWVTLAESNGYFSGCDVLNSSWHGTHTAGTIGAAGNNGSGVAGINWVSKILPVRVLGKCGGYSSDIADGMRWAAGLSVAGVPANSNPAKVLNVSIGGSGPCGVTYQNAIDAITAAGATVVVSAGNSMADASTSHPGNCNGVITVAATNRSGNLAWYSNYGSLVEISAPGGETSPTLANGVLSTANTGTQGPGAETYAYKQGTSMAAPHVAGVASLLLSMAPSLTPAQVLQIMRTTATAFPVGSTCNTSKCGSGIVNAGGAVGALPRITGTVPTFAWRASAAFTLTVTGQNFAANSIVKWNGTPRTTVVVSSSQLQVGILASDLSSAGAAKLSVSGTHPVYGSITTAERPFIIAVSRLLLPMVFTSLQAPTLNAISNPGGAGYYSVTWTGISGVTSYTLQEDDNSGLAHPTAVYSGGLTFWNAAGKPVGTYYYRVRANDASGSSAWSNVRSVVVAAAASGPTPGYWDGNYSDFLVTADRKYIQNYSTYIYVSGCGYYKITYPALVPIAGNQYSFSGAFYASGTFTSQLTATGHDGLNQYYIYGCGYVSSNNGPVTESFAWKSPSAPIQASVVAPDAVEAVPSDSHEFQIVRVD